MTRELLQEAAEALRPWRGLLNHVQTPDDYMFRMNYVTGQNVTYGDIRRLDTTLARIEAALKEESHEANH